jgi:hypothetical protein
MNRNRLYDLFVILCKEYVDFERNPRMTAKHPYTLTDLEREQFTREIAGMVRTVMEKDVYTGGYFE